MTFKDEQSTDLLAWTNAAQQTEVKGNLFQSAKAMWVLLRTKDARCSTAAIDNRKHLPLPYATLFTIALQKNKSGNGSDPQ